MQHAASARAITPELKAEVRAFVRSLIKEVGVRRAAAELGLSRQTIGAIVGELGARDGSFAQAALCMRARDKNTEPPRAA